MPQDLNTVSNEIDAPSSIHQLSEEQAENTDLNDISLPYTVEGVTFMSPGTWNDTKYDGEEIEKAYSETDWSDHEVVSLFYEHDDEDARHWVGEVKNPRVEGDELKGDLEIIHEDAARQIAYGARFGISPKVTGYENRDRMQDFRYDNFSLVFNPAVKTTYINSEQDEQEDNVIQVKTNMSDTEDNSQELSDEQIDRIEELASTVEYADVEDLANIIAPFMQVDAEALREHLQDFMSEENEDHKEDKEYGQEDVVDQVVDQVMAKLESQSEAENSDEEETEKEADDESVEEAETEEEYSETDVQEFSEFVEEMKQENPGMSYQEITKEYEEAQKDASDIVAEVKNELESKIDSLEDKLDSKEEELSQIKEDVENPRTVSQLSGKTEDGQTVEEAVKEMSDKDLDTGMMRNLLKKQGSTHLL